MDLLTLETSFKQNCLISANMLIPIHNECSKSNDDLGVQHLNIEKDMEEILESKDIPNNETDSEDPDDSESVEWNGSNRHYDSEEEASGNEDETVLKSSEAVFIEFIEEEMWDDDSDEYWDPSVRDVPWLIPPTAFPCYNPRPIDATPLEVVEGQFDDSTEDS